MTTWFEFANLKQGMYTIYDKTTFRIYNAGNVCVHPFIQDLRIMIEYILKKDSRNLFDGVYHDWYIYDYGKSEPTAYLRRNYMGEEHTLMVQVTPGETYTVKVHDKKNSNQFTIATAPTEPKFDNRGVFDMGKPVMLQGKNTHPGREYTLEIPEGSNYLYVMVAQDQEPPGKVQVEQGDKATEYKPHPDQDDSFFIELKNVTNGSRFKAKDKFKKTDEIILDGPNITKNGLAYFRKTTHEFIWLSPGWNEFKLTGVDAASISFDFPFYYL